MISTPTHAWEKRGFWVNEGAAVLKRNGKIFITYSASATDHNYCMGLLTADEDSNLRDPASWTKSKEPVFKISEENGQYGPGHNSFTVSKDGSEDILILHRKLVTLVQFQDIRGERTGVYDVPYTCCGGASWRRPIA